MRDLQAGDVVFFYGVDRISKVIEWCTWGPSHVAIAFQHNGRVLLVESTTMCPFPCAITGRECEGVQAHPIEERVATYPGRVEVLPLARPLCDQDSARLTEEVLRNQIRRPYDLPGAIWSGTRFAKFTRLLPYPDLGSLFCSELVAWLLMVVHRMCPENPALYNPASLRRTLRRRLICGTPEWIHAE